MPIITKTITQEVYVSENGKETPVQEMEPSHVMNALLKAEREYAEEATAGRAETCHALKAEILRRLTPTKKES